MVSKDINTLNFMDFTSSFSDYLSKCSVVVETTETGDVLLLHCGSIVAEDKGVGISRISYNNTPHIRFSNRQSLRLLHEDFFVDLQKVFALHAWLARKSAKEDYDVSILKKFLWLISRADLSV